MGGLAGGYDISAGKAERACIKSSGLRSHSTASSSPSLCILASSSALANFNLDDAKAVVSFFDEEADLIRSLRVC